MPLEQLLYSVVMGLQYACMKLYEVIVIDGSPVLYNHSCDVKPSDQTFASEGETVHVYNNELTHLLAEIEFSATGLLAHSQTEGVVEILDDLHVLQDTVTYPLRLGLDDATLGSIQATLFADV